MAGKSKAERKKNKARNAEARARDDNGPLEHQREHGAKTGEIDAVQPVTVHLKKTETTINGKPVYVDEAIVATVRRCMDAEVAQELDQEYWRERALEQIVGAWKRKVSGVGMRIFDPNRVPGRGDAAAAVDFNADLERIYADWVRHCESHGIDWKVVTDRFCHGTSLRVIEHTARKRNGWAKGEIVRAVDVWCELKKWVRKEKAA
jgi:hypothetical protein